MIMIDDYVYNPAIHFPTGELIIASPYMGNYKIFDTPFKKI